MGRVIPFSHLSTYLDELNLPESHHTTILDTNILITAGYEVREGHEEVAKVLDVLADYGYRLLATVNTRAEFLEFQRRLILTEVLLDIVDEHSEVKIPKAARSRIQVLKGTVATSVRSDPERDFIFNDQHLKSIKRLFSAGAHSGQLGWLKLCQGFLEGRIKAEDQELLDSGVEYVSQHDPSQKEIFESLIDWPEAVEICETSGASFSDSMILNAFRCSRCPFIISRDFDIGYAVLADPSLGDVLMPDRMARDYRHYHFNRSYY